MAISKLVPGFLSLIVATGAAYAADGSPIDNHERAERLLAGGYAQASVESTGEVSAPYMDGHARAAALLASASQATGNSGEGITGQSVPEPLDGHEHARRLILGSKSRTDRRLGEHPAVIVQRQNAQQRYDYASKFYLHPAGSYLYAEAPGSTPVSGVTSFQVQVR
jgi:hypothetical protein